MSHSVYINLYVSLYVCECYCVRLCHHIKCTRTFFFVIKRGHLDLREKIYLSNIKSHLKNEPVVSVYFVFSVCLTRVSGLCVYCYNDSQVDAHAHMETYKDMHKIKCRLTHT